MTPFEQKLKHIQGSFKSSINIDIFKGEDGEKKPTPDEYVKGLGADKWNPSKIKREMKHHESMAKLTGDAGHMKVYESLSKMHKDHYAHSESDSKEKKTLAAKKAKETKAKNAKAKAKEEKSKTAAKDSKNGKVSQNGKDSKNGKDVKGTPKAKQQMDDSKAKPKKDDKVKDDSKEIEVNVKVKKGREAELLGILGVDIEKSSKYGKGKKQVKIAVKGKKGVHFRTQTVGSELTEEKKPKINKNTKVGGGTPIAAAINALVLKMQNSTGKAKGDILTEVGKVAGFGVKKDGSPASLDAPKSTMYKVLQGKMDIAPDKLKAVAEYFNVTVKDLEAGAKVMENTGFEQQKVDEVDVEEVTSKATGINYDAVREIADSKMNPDDKAVALIKMGLKNPGIIQRITGHHKVYPIKDIMDEMGEDIVIQDGFDMTKFRGDKDKYQPGQKNRPPGPRFQAYKESIKAMIDGDIIFMFAYGAGGVGKSYAAEQVIVDENKLKEFDPDNPAEDYDYVTISGRGGMGACITALYEHNGKMIVFDDYDSVIKPEGGSGKNDMANLLKAVFDKGKAAKRIVNHGMTTLKDRNGNDIPKAFKYTGKAMFITNLEWDDVPQPIKDRTMGFKHDLTMDLPERIEKIEEILNDPHTKIKDGQGNPIDVPYEIRHQAYEFMKEYAYDPLVLGNNNGESVSPRTWEGLALMMYKDSQSSEEQLVKNYGDDWWEKLQDKYYSTISLPKNAYKRK